MLRGCFSTKLVVWSLFHLPPFLFTQGNIVYRQIRYKEFQQMVSSPWRPKYVSIPDLKKTPIYELEGGYCWEGKTPYEYTFRVFGQVVTKRDEGGSRPGEWMTQWKPYGAAQTVVGAIPVFIRRLGQCATEYLAEEWAIYADKQKPRADAEAPLEIFPMEPPISPRGLILIIEQTADGHWRVKIADFVNYKAWEGEEDFYSFLERIGGIRKARASLHEGLPTSTMPAVRQIYDVKGRPNACILELAHRKEEGGWQEPPYYVLLEWD